MLKELVGGVLLLGQICAVRAGYSSPDLHWRQFYRVYNQYNAPKAGRPERVRIGSGRYRMSSQGAELRCDFPSTTVIISNIVWERADLGALRDLDRLYKSVGQIRHYAVIGRPRGSTLQLPNISPFDRGLYRCIATAANPFTNAIFTIFQDIPFYPELEYKAKYLPVEPEVRIAPVLPIARPQEVFRDFHQHHRQRSSFFARGTFHS